MEVFCTNVPLDMTYRTMTAQLEPFMKKLSIEDYNVDKPRKKRHARITFLSERDGQKFLASHGEVVISPPVPDGADEMMASLGALSLQNLVHQSYFNGNRRRPGNSVRPVANGGNPTNYPARRFPARARLDILGHPVFCKRSNQQPSPITLRGIRHNAEAQAVTEQRATQHDVTREPSAVVFELHSCFCGHIAYMPEGELAFLSECGWTRRGIAKFYRRKLTITLEQLEIKVLIPFETITEMVYSSKEASLTFTLTTVPTFIYQNPFVVAGPRCTRKLSIDARHLDVVSHNLVYAIHVMPNDFDSKVNQIKATNQITVSGHDILFPRPIQPAFQPFAKHLAALKKYLSRTPDSRSLPYGILYLLQAFADNAKLHPATVLALTRELEERQASRSSLITADALRVLLRCIEPPSPGLSADVFQVRSLVRQLCAIQDDINRGDGMRAEIFKDTASQTRIYRATVTPGRIILQGLELESKNRILRMFSSHQDHFLRVQFCDENGNGVHFSAAISLDAVFDRFKQVLRDGILVAGRYFMFLGFSHSSLRAHSAWFSAPFVQRGQLHTHFTIIDSLGDFKPIKSPARRAARIGQAFSETPYAVPIAQEDLRFSVIGDVKKRDAETGDERIFSDGVGTLSPKAMEIVWGYLPSQRNLSTCFQIRFGGSKGMLALDTSLAGRRFCIRPSMTKFETTSMENLEICDTASKPIPMMLNRQLIKIMEDMGTAPTWFLSAQEKELCRLRAITANIYNTAKFIETQAIGDSIRLHSFFRRVHDLEIDYRKDSFLRNVVQAVVLKELRLLKHKARILVQKGITLFGIMDETGFLREGEVYVTYDTLAGRYANPPGNQPVLVARSPALHPGDVQMAQNVVPPPGHRLTFLSNCIAFSQHGTRDLPSQLSGGDLDGDIYNVIWDIEAFPDCIFAPADYPRVKPLELDREVSKADIANFFVDFMRTDHLGVIATRHMILADQEDRGTLSEKCIKLAELHSTAVDFSKTGIPVEMKALPPAERFRPDFLAPGRLTHLHDRSEIELIEYVTPPGQEDDDDENDGPRYKYYKSEKVLGKLYRSVDENKVWHQDVRRPVPTGGPSFWDQLLSAVKTRCAAIGDIRWVHRADEARRLRDTYEDAILTAMNEYSEHPVHPLSELEVFVGFIINKTGTQTNRQRDKSMKLKDEFERIAGWIVKAMRSPANFSGFTSELDSLELCLACAYEACIPDAQRSAGRTRFKRQDLVSFRIVAAATLLRELDALERGMTLQRPGREGGGYVGVG